MGNDGTAPTGNSNTQAQAPIDNQVTCVAPWATQGTQQTPEQQSAPASTPPSATFFRGEGGSTDKAGEDETLPVPQIVTSDPLPAPLQVGGPTGGDITIGGWTVRTCKKPILPSTEMDEWSRDLGMTILPEMLFGNNSVSLQHAASGFKFDFNGKDALKHCLTETSPFEYIQCLDAEKWKHREINDPNVTIKPMDESYDWTYSTSYKGTSSKSDWKPSDVKAIPQALLTTLDPIQFFDEVILYEDELHDFGSAAYTVKLRVMPKCLFVLARFRLRVDGVLFRIVETRVYTDFRESQVLREWQVRELPVDEVDHKEDPNLLDAAEVYNQLEVKRKEMEEINL